ncbi:hypothetical protein Ciccas_012520 [Cichlidogyrus casuarinus]|uniref:RING-type domain-containing protein n=1 Tax=Cichlidogyrus casuarinus TaxID=1844966 RepID=A0ABD2PN58_9PLAT
MDDLDDLCNLAETEHQLEDHLLIMSQIYASWNADASDLYLSSLLELKQLVPAALANFRPVLQQLICSLRQELRNNLDYDTDNMLQLLDKFGGTGSDFQLERQVWMRFISLMLDSWQISHGAQKQTDPSVSHQEFSAMLRQLIYNASNFVPMPKIVSSILQQATANEDTTSHVNADNFVIELVDSCQIESEMCAENLELAREDCQHALQKLASLRECGFFRTGILSRNGFCANCKRSLVRPPPEISLLQQVQPKLQHFMQKCFVFPCGHSFHGPCHLQASGDSIFHGLSTKTATAVAAEEDEGAVPASSQLQCPMCDRVKCFLPATLSLSPSCHFDCHSNYAAPDFISDHVQPF